MEPSIDRSRSLVPKSTVLKSTGLSNTSLYQSMSKREFPRPVKIGQASRWVAAEVQDWIDRQIARRDSLTRGYGSVQDSSPCELGVPADEITSHQPIVPPPSAKSCQTARSPRQRLQSTVKEIL